MRRWAIIKRKPGGAAVRPCEEEQLARRDSHVWPNHDLTPAAAAATYTTSSQVVQHTGEGRDEMEDLERTSSCIPGLCILHLQVQPRWLLFDLTIVCWHLYCYPLVAGVLWGIGFLAIWEQKEGIGAPFIGTLPSTYPPVEPAGYWQKPLLTQKVRIYCLLLPVGLKELLLLNI